MSDGSLWYKLWCNSLTDPALESLSLENWARWVRLGAYIKAHGTKGRLWVSEPFTALKNLLRVDTLDTLKNVLLNLPNLLVKFTVTPPVTGVHIEFKNWHKYQIDNSVERVRKFRWLKSAKNVTVQEVDREVDKEKEKEKESNDSLSAQAAPPGLAPQAHRSSEAKTLELVKKVFAPVEADTPWEEGAEFFGKAALKFVKGGSA